MDDRTPRWEGFRSEGGRGKVRPPIIEERSTPLQVIARTELPSSVNQGQLMVRRNQRVS